MKLVIVKCKDRNYKCESNIENISVNDTVVVSDDKFSRYAEIVNIYDVDNYKGVQYKVIRKASNKEIIKNKKNIDEEKKIIETTKKLAKQLDLSMSVIDAFYTVDYDQLIITYVSDTRVDFRNLAKKLASLYKIRIELRQIGIRDKAKCISGLGQCGRKLCCSSFLNDLDSVSISMAKNQRLALNPNKINGVCGRLLCCLNYENTMYEENKVNIPNVGEIIKNKNGEIIGTVCFVDILNRKYAYVDENNNKVEVTLDNNEKCRNCKSKKCDK